jgi:hypothetical protein
MTRSRSLLAAFPGFPVPPQTVIREVWGGVPDASLAEI